MPPFSSPSGPVFVPLRDRSSLATGLWLLRHGLAACAVVVAGLPVYVKLLGLTCVVASTWLSRPARCRPIAFGADGSWALPDAGISGTGLATGSRFTRWWVELRLSGNAAAPVRVVLWRDAFAPADWRRLLIVLRERRSDG